MCLCSIWLTFFFLLALDLLTCFTCVSMCFTQWLPKDSLASNSYAACLFRFTDENLPLNAQLSMKLKHFGWLAFECVISYPRAYRYIYFHCFTFTHKQHRMLWLARWCHVQLFLYPKNFRETRAPKRQLHNTLNRCSQFLLNAPL